MNYLDIIPLTDAKTYLRLEDTLTEDDSQIQRMIRGALSYIEQYTNVILFEREKIYNVSNGCVKVYDFPINSEVTTEFTKEVKSLYTNYYTNESELVLNVGYDDIENIPQELIEVAYTLIKSMYYEKENNKTILDGLDSISTMTLNQYKRFLL